MRPGDLPDRSFMCLKDDFGMLLTIIAHTANLQEAFAIAAGNLSAIVVKLAVIDVVFMLCVDREDIV
jgi:hypothetical protein